MVTSNELARLRPLENDLRLIPTGGGRGKVPLIENWPESPGLKVDELRKQFPTAKSVGVITNPLLCFDIDGKSAEVFAQATGRQPDEVKSWRVNRTTDPYRYKLLFLPTKQQLNDLQQKAVSHSHRTKDKCVDKEGKLITKAEAEEIFCHPGKQVIVAGEHPESGGHYFWPENAGPEALSPPPDEWWARVVEVAKKQQRQVPVGNLSTTKVAGTEWIRIDHCPICGRGPDDNPVCQLHHDGNTLRCFLGQTFSPPTNLIRGQIVSGTDWAFSRMSPSGWGEFLVFVKDKPNNHQLLRRWLRND